MKKIIVVSSTPRKGGNSEVLANSFAKGAMDAGNSVKKIVVRDLALQFCRGCMCCQNESLKTYGSCVLKDDMNSLLDDVQYADVLVFATPIYYYSVSGQLKTFLDRLNPLYIRDNRFKEVYLIAACADDDIHAIDGATTAVQGWVDCFDDVTLAGVLCGYELDGVGDAQNSKYVEMAYELGKEV